MDEKIFICLICNKEYNSYMGLWKHKKTKHDENKKIIKKEIEKKKINNKTCKYCNKEFSDRRNRWRHENTICKLKFENINNSSINNTNNLTNSNLVQNNIQTQNIQTQNNIQNQNINITINQLGCEDISILNQDNIETIINEGLNCVLKMIELINFNKDHPQNHSFCSTSLNNKYTNVLNTETNEIEKKRKIEVFDNVLMYGINHLDMLKDKITDKKKKKHFIEKIDELITKMHGTDKGYKKIFLEQLNAISYNNKKLITQTWDTYLKNLLVLNL
jgi:hypothetical protein